MEWKQITKKKKSFIFPVVEFKSFNRPPNFDLVMMRLKSSVPHNSLFHTKFLFWLCIPTEILKFHLMSKLKNIRRAFGIHLKLHHLDDAQSKRLNICLSLLFHLFSLTHTFYIVVKNGCDGKQEALQWIHWGECWMWNIYGGI